MFLLSEKLFLIESSNLQNDVKTLIGCLSLKSSPCFLLELLDLIKRVLEKKIN